MHALDSGTHFFIDFHFKRAVVVGDISHRTYFGRIGDTVFFGSCSGKNRLSFSLYLMAYPETAIEYVVVHELAHIRHHDHSPAFYREVEAYLPDWRARRALLRR